MSNFDLCFVFNLNPTQPNPIQSKLKCQMYYLMSEYWSHSHWIVVESLSLSKGIKL